MRPLLTLAACLAIAGSLMAQGTVNFANRVPGIVDAKILDVGGLTGAGSSVVAQLYAGADIGSLAPVGAAIALRDGAAAGYFVGEVRTIPGIAPGGAAVVVMRAYEASYGSYAAAQSGGGKYGESAALNLTATGNPVGSPPTTPVNLVGLQGFTLQVVPEPATLALLGLGALGLVLRRRK